MSNKLSPQDETAARLDFFRSMRGTLLLLFLAVSLIPLIVVGMLAYLQAQQALQTEATNKLVAVRDLKTDWITAYFNERLSDVRFLSRDPAVAAAMHDFDRAVETSMDTLNTDEAGAMGHYRSLYLGKPDLVDANDNSDYSVVHAQYHAMFKDYLKEYGYYDLFLVEPHSGNIIYTVEKEDDFGTNLKNGQYAETNLGQAFQKTVMANQGFSMLADFVYYEPSQEPAAFVAAPIFEKAELVGVLAFQIPIDQIDAIMSDKAGMGETGEAYIVGADKLMRSDSRFFQETTILKREIDTVTANKALNGQSGVEITPDYRDIPVLSAYKPLNISGVNWAILAEIDQSEAFAPVQQMFIMTLILMGLGALVVAGVAIVVANSIARPVRLVAQTITQLANEDMPRLVQAIQAVAQGDLTTTFELRPNPVNLRSRNEIGLMAQAFNSMGEALSVVSDNFGQMIANLRQLVGQVQAGAEQVAQASQQLNSAADQSSRAGQQVATTIQQVAQGTTQQTQAVTDVTGGVEQISRAAEGIARGSQDQAHGVQKTSDLVSDMAALVDQVGQVADAVTKANSRMSQAAHNGVTAVNQTGQGMETIRSRTTVTADKVKEMGSRSKEIGRIIETIDDIADKTDMLALNAAVEAARAGEAGRGFAVVADQVRKLSEDSKVATRDIANLIEWVQDTINEAVTAMHSTTVEVDNGVKLTQDTTQSLQDILQAAEEAVGLAERIDQAVFQLKQKSQGVVTAIESVSVVVEENTAVAEEMAANSQEVTAAMEGVAGVAEENSASAEEVSALAEEMSAQAEEVVASAEELSALAGELHMSVAQFRVDETVRIERERALSRAQTTAGSEVTGRMAVAKE